MKSELLFLKQYGFTDKFLESIYKYCKDVSSNPDSVVFDKKLFNKYYQYEVTKHTPYVLRSIKSNLKRINRRAYNSFCYKNESRIMNYFTNNYNPTIAFKYDKKPINSFITNSKDKPLFMYSRGNTNLISDKYKFLGVTGSRNIDHDHASIIPKLIKHYVNEGYITVSGLARGSDTIVHKATLQMKAPTISMLPTNFTHISPASNRQLAQKVFNSGLALTSIGPLERVYKFNFLERDKYIVYLADKILVTQTRFHSGTMDTIKYAHKLNKDIYFVEQNDPKINDYLKNKFNAHEITFNEIKPNIK